MKQIIPGLTSTVLTLGFIFSSFLVNAQELTISDDEITRFINAVGPYTDVLKQMQQDMANEEPTPEKVMAAKQKIQDTLAEYGWGDEYQDKSNAISQMFGIIGAEKEAKNMSDEYRQTRIEAVKVEIDKYAARYGEQSVVNVRARYEDLDAAFSSLSMN